MKKKEFLRRLQEHTSSEAQVAAPFRMVMKRLASAWVLRVSGVSIWFFGACLDIRTTGTSQPKLRDFVPPKKSKTSLDPIKPKRETQSPQAPVLAGSMV